THAPHVHGACRGQHYLGGLQEGMPEAPRGSRRVPCLETATRIAPEARLKTRRHAPGRLPGEANEATRAARPRHSATGRATRLWKPRNVGELSRRQPRRVPVPAG